MQSEVLDELFEAAQIPPEPICGRIYVRETDFEAQLEARLDLEDALRHIKVSEGIAQECRAELLAAQRRGYRE
jgi:hypothetical protein